MRPIALPGPRTASLGRLAFSVELPYPSVCTAPHATAFTRTPSGVHAAASDRVRLFIPAFAAPYGATIGSARKLAPDEMFTIAPLPWSSIGFAAARDRNHTLARFRSMISCHSAVDQSSGVLLMLPPALLTSTSTRPRSPRAVAPRRPHCSLSV